MTAKEKEPPMDAIDFFSPQGLASILLTYREQ
jgi:hypothetical protein